MTKIRFGVLACLVVSVSTTFGGGACIEKPQFDKPVFDKPQRAEIIFERNMLIAPVIEPLFFDQPVLIRRRPVRPLREKPVFERPVFEKNCPPRTQAAPKPASAAITASRSKGVAPALTARISSVPVIPSVKVADNCNCSPTIVGKSLAAR